MTSCSKYISRITLTVTLTACSVFSLGLSGCASGSRDESTHRDFLSKVFRPYRPDVVQGNFISKEQLETIRPGMTRDQVKQLLGTPLLTDVFHGDRWDYVFVYRQGDTEQVQERKIRLYFNGLNLEKMDTEALPSEQELVDEIDALRKKRPKSKPVVTSEAAGSPVSTVPNPTSGVGIPAGGNRQDTN